MQSRAKAWRGALVRIGCGAKCYAGMSGRGAHHHRTGHAETRNAKANGPPGCSLSPAFRSSGRLSGRVLVEIDENVVALQHHLIGPQRQRARRRLHGAGLHVEGAEMQAALDDAILEEAVGEARRGVGAFVVRDVELCRRDCRRRAANRRLRTPSPFPARCRTCAQTRTTLSAMGYPLLPNHRAAAALAPLLRHKTARRRGQVRHVIAKGGEFGSIPASVRRVVIGPNCPAQCRLVNVMTGE